MSIIKGFDDINNPLQESQLNKKGLCDYVVNVAVGCLHGCTFCYVPSTPSIRTKQTELINKGVNNPQMDWGQYLFIRENIHNLLADILISKRKWKNTPSGKGVILFCSTTDPYQNGKVATITRKSIEVLKNQRIRILTRSPLWNCDLDILVDKNITVGMSLPHLDDQLSRQIEPQAPLPSDRYKALMKGYQAGCRLYVAIAPTPPTMTQKDFKQHLETLMEFNPEVIFWEPINGRGTNGKRMANAGLDFSVDKTQWTRTFMRQWAEIEDAAEVVGCLDRLHIWVDPGLKGLIPEAQFNKWYEQPTIEQWE